LDGDSITAPVKGAHYAPGQGQRSWNDQGRQVITEDIKIELAGSYRQITDFITQLAALLHSVPAGGRHAVNGLWLCLQEPDDQPLQWWMSQVLSASLHIDSAGLAQRQLGQQLITLQVTRLDEWWHSGGTLSTYFPTGQFYGVQNYIFNHKDADTYHANMVYIQAAAVLGDLPALTNITVGIDQPGHALGDVLLGCAWPDQDNHLPGYVGNWEGENFNQGADCTSRVVTGSQPDCSAATYCTFTWTSTAEAQLAVSSSSYGDWWHGRPIKPLLRLQSSRAYTDLYLKLKAIVPTTSAVVYETEWVLYQPNTNFVEFPTAFLPPEGMTSGTSLEIALYVLKATAGAYTLPLDVLQLWPIDGGFRRLKSLTYQAGAQYLNDEAATDQVYWSNQAYSVLMPSVVGQGQRISFLPARRNVLYVLNLTNGTTWTIDDHLTLSAGYTPRKMNL
jgi:hypothetical protein